MKKPVGVIAVGAQLQAARLVGRGSSARGRRGRRAAAAAPPRPRSRAAARRCGPRSRGGRSCRSSRRASRRAAGARRPAQRPAWIPARRSITLGDLRQRASGREASAPRSEQGGSTSTRSKPGAIRLRRVGLDHGDAVEAEPRRLGGDFAGPAGVQLDRDHLAAVAHPGGDLAGLDPRAGAEVEDLLARPAGRGPRPPRPSRGSAGSARRPRPAPGPPRRCGPRPRSTPAGPAASAPRATARLHARPLEPPEHRLALGPQRVDPHRHLGGLVAGGQQRARRPSAPNSSHHISRQPFRAEWATAARSGVESSPSRRGQLRALADRSAQDGVDQAGGVGGAGPLDQLDRLVDRGVVGRGVGEEQLVEAEPQRGQHRRVEQSRRALGEPFDRDVAGAAALHGAVGEALGLGALAAVETGRSASARKARSV